MPTNTNPTELAVPTTVEGIRELVRRAQKGDKGTLPSLRKLMENPAYIDMLGGNLARYVEESFVKSLNEEDLSMQVAVHAKLAELRRELLGDNPTPVERLLVERAVACWLQVQDADIRYAVGRKELSVQQADFNLRRMDAANRRYLAALKVLALVRKLAVPALHINVARKHVDNSLPRGLTRDERPNAGRVSPGRLGSSPTHT